MTVDSVFCVYVVDYVYNAKIKTLMYCNIVSGFLILRNSHVTFCQNSIHVNENDQTQKCLICHCKYENNKSRAIAGRTVQCRCKFRYELNFTMA